MSIILDDGINVLGSTWANTPMPVEFAPQIATPADGASFADGAQVVFTGTSMPGETITVDVWEPAAGEWVLLAGPTQASTDGVWTTDPYTVDASARVNYRVTAWDGRYRSTPINIAVTVTDVVEQTVEAAPSRRSRRKKSDS